ncbi:DUF2306 domain-containing protein [Phenylobacterium sp.]|uniref:DUF2306 domain-containing protein n=1 Tax=Phenylobacterium sp. TaxID=1871053 RepID=UPI002811E9E6|nr:DUF2306 domain-containing protein [Phenylobacterium sp.]
MNTWISRSLWSLGAVLSVAVALFSYRYVVFAGLLADNVMANLMARPWIAVHAGGASTALLVGAFQLLPAIRRRRAMHRWLGRLYAAGCVVGGVAALVLAPTTTAGPLASVGFALLGVIWLGTTVQAWRLARARRFDEHRRWMIRSFALTFAAVTLRLYLPIGPVLGMDFMQSYVLVSWLSWGPNLLAAELYLRRHRGIRPLLTNPVSSAG